jgi:phage FluMu protein Com
MPIEFACSHCGQILRVGDDTAGKRAKCPKCQSVVPIPAASASSSAPASQPTDWDHVSDSDSPSADEKVNPFAAPQQPSDEALYIPLRLDYVKA